MLNAKNIVCGYGGAPIVKGISFHLQPGDRLAVLGPNGCGKTTLMRALSGLLPFEGSVTAAGLDLRRASRREAARAVALMSQMGSADFGYTVYQTVMMGRYAHQKTGLWGGVSQKDRAVVEQCLLDTGLSDLRDRLVTQLSGGQLQRVFLARVFAQEPAVILLDEPTNHLDLKYQVEMVELLRRWSNQEAHCVVGVLHDINLALSFANRLLLMKEGLPVYEGPADGLDLELLQSVYEIDVRAWMHSALERWT